jgi:hypothetical protein
LQPEIVDVGNSQWRCLIHNVFASLFVRFLRE